MKSVNKRSPWKPILEGTEHSRSLGIYTQKELHELVMYERIRADRTGGNLSLVLCELNGTSEKRNQVLSVVDELAKTIRTTDHLGWFGDSELGVILPLTSKAGAEHFVENLNGSTKAAKIAFSIHSYPDQWIDNSNGNSSNGNGPKGHDSNTGRKSRTCSCTQQFTRVVPLWKRALDIFGSATGLIVLSPFLALVALYIKIVSPGPVLFRQTRVGLARREFPFLKFRTMHHNNNESVHSHHAKDFISSDKPMSKLDAIDPRIIPGGRILRKIAVDELPQLINILKGEMSLVGPRPCIPYEADEYQQWHTNRFSILPGLTGLWQVSGKNKLTFQQMIRLDIEYSRRISFWFDLWMILRTVPTVAGLAIEGTVRRLRLGREKLTKAATEAGRSSRAPEQSSARTTE